MSYPVIPVGANHVTIHARAGDESGMDFAQNFSVSLYNDPYRELVFEGIIDVAVSFLDQVLLDNPHYDEHFLTVVFRMSDQSSTISYPLTP